MCRVVAFSMVVLFCADPVLAQPAKKTLVMEPGPKGPAESLKCLQPRPGFTVELMAAEPLVQDPIAFAWGPDGKFWVVEMGDYPLGVDGKNKFGGKVKFLEKTKGDGPYDKATVFLDNLGYPSGVTPWGKGVLVTCAPDIFYAEDTDGDGRADKKVVLYTGFHEGNQQHRVNGLVWGLDNWLYGANGDSGGKVKSLKTNAEVSISGRDFRIKPDEGLIEAQTGQTQFGRARDDWGNWFGNNNSNPLFHYVLADHYLRRNPHVVYPDPRVNVSVTPGAARIYPLSKPLPRLNSPQSVDHFTSANSAIVYRDDLFGPEFGNNTFVSEPVHNLVHREIMTPKGVTFTSRRADDEKESEFLASTDNWFRPTMLQTGPDGALWVADMYRYVIEHPEWIPLDWQRKLELRAGHDKGRIYRVYPKDKKPRPIVRLDKLDIPGLVACLESPNGWTRDTAQQLLGQRDDFHATSQTLRKMLAESKNPLARLHVLCALEGLNALDVFEVLRALQDPHPGVRRQAIRCCEPLLASRVIEEVRLQDLQKDTDPQVRLQLACSLGACTNAKVGKLLGQMFLRDADDRYQAAAVLSSLNHQNWPAFLAVIQKGAGPLDSTYPSLLGLAAGWGSPQDTAHLLLRRFIQQPGKPRAEQFLLIASLLDDLEARHSTLAQLLVECKDEKIRARFLELQTVFDAARAAATDPKTPMGEKIAAIRLLGRGLEKPKEDRTVLAGLLGPQFPEEVQSAALQGLGKIRYSLWPAQVLKPWKSYSPGIRAQALDVLLSRQEGTRALLEALEQKQVAPSEIDAIRRQRLLQHPRADIKKAAAKLLAASSSPDRHKLVNEYWLALPAQGDGQRGQKIFVKSCAACHRLGDLGQQVGPELASVADKSPQGLLTAILDPNRAVEARYVNYLATTKAGLSLSGLLANETTTTITLVAADGKKHELLRKDLDELASTGKSAMPEGLEKEISPADMADLLGFLRSQVATPKKFPGNNPELVRAGSDESLRLWPSNAAIYGKTLVLEKKHGNLGFWSSEDDQAVWTVAVPKVGPYAVWLDWACETAGNAYQLQAGPERLTGQVKGTASWDLYRQARIGTIVLQAGRQEVVFRSLGPIRGALLDLQAIRLVPEKGP